MNKADEKRIDIMNDLIDLVLTESIENVPFKDKKIISNLFIRKIQNDYGWILKQLSVLSPEDYCEVLSVLSCDIVRLWKNMDYYEKKERLLYS